VAEATTHNKACNALSVIPRYDDAGSSSYLRRINEAFGFFGMLYRRQLSKIWAYICSTYTHRLYILWFSDLQCRSQCRADWCL